ncbi:ATP-binding protein [Desulfosporosinus sp. FKA]|uniref:two-component system sensor histidine kinase NtrB n=1 Tax=Desulfosporosinus sp. FKA TaxID=1969834 RepID=UPI000B4A17DD|nr:ATP-binding protein [Desulfosporosinus sp. FKA]
MSFRKKSSITQRIFFLTSAILFGLITFVIIITSYRTAKIRQLEYERQLYIVSSILGSRLNQSYDNILRAKGALNKPVEEEVRVLNTVLQPIVDDVLKDYPSLGAGFYSIKLDHNLAIEPNFSSDKLISISHSQPFFVVYETGKPILTKVSSSVSWGSPILNYTSPVFDKNGIIIGHTWVNVNLHDMYVEIITNAIEILIVGLFIMGGILVVLRKLFTQLSKEVSNFAFEIVSEKPNLDLQLLPELNPVYSKIKEYVNEKQSILDSMTDCFFAINENWQISFVNSAAESIFGRSRNELLGKKLTEVFEVNQIAMENYQHVMIQKETVHFEVISENLGNKWLEISAYPVQHGLTCYFRDITSRKVGEKEIARLDRLNLVGQMAAGIGHEIRNPMTTVRGYLQLLEEKPEYSSQKQIFELMISELDRANSIISEFLSLARTKQTKLELQNLNDVLFSLYPLLEADTFNQNKQIEYIPGDIPNLLLNKKEITQMVLNLVRNGLEAMKDRGRLKIRTFLKGNQVVFTVEDEGSGIPKDDLTKVGTPFFTTKEHGTGLGLATCFKIAETHKAKIDIDTGPQGTKFIISFSVPTETRGLEQSVV